MVKKMVPENLDYSVNLNTGKKMVPGNRDHSWNSTNGKKMVLGNRDDSSILNNGKQMVNKNVGGKPPHHSLKFNGPREVGDMSRTILSI